MTNVGGPHFLVGTNPFRNYISVIAFPFLTSKRGIRKIGTNNGVCD